MRTSIITAAGPPPLLADVVRTLAWQSVRRGWSNILSVVGILCGMPTLIYGMIRVLDAVTATNLIEAGGTLKFLYFLFTIVTLPTLVLFEVFRVRPLYRLPLTTRQIVNAQLGIGIVGVMSLYLVTAAYYRLFFAASIPVWGPMLFLVPCLVVLAGLAALLIDARWWKPPLVLAALGACIYWITRRFR